MLEEMLRCLRKAPWGDFASDRAYLKKQIVGQIGKIKDQGEFVEFLAHAFVEAGLAKSVRKAEPEVRRLLGAEHVTHEWVGGQSEALYKQFMKDGVLAAMRRELEAP